MKNHTFLPLLLILTLIVPKLLFSTDIIELHRNDAYGRPAAPFSIGKVVTVTGVVTAPSGLYHASYLDIFIQDSTAGINVYSTASGLKKLALGDLVRVTGPVSHYYGLTEIKDPTELTVLAVQQPLPDPLLLDCARVSGTFQADNSEPNESRLVRLNNVQITGISGDTYTIADQSGSCLLYMDPDARLQALPEGTFDVIGLLKQFDRSTTPPVKAGYEILPRFNSDILSRSGPVFVTRPVETAITPGSVEFSWKTDRPSTSFFRYGKSTEAMTMSAGDSSHTTDHTVILQSLEPATLYHGEAGSSDSTGSIRSSELLFMTASARSSGTIEAFFTQSVDTSLAWHEKAHGNTDLSRIIIEKINQARYSLDIHFYRLTQMNIAIAIANARKRGLSVRFICDYDSEDHIPSENMNIQWLKDNNIPVISDLYGGNDGRAYSHNKFVIIDHRDKSSGLDDYLWTGSANATQNGSVTNGENMLLIQDESLCAAYTIEFNEMWGSETEVPDPVNSRFGDRKRDNTPHRFSVGGRWIEQYMSPSDDTESHIISAIQEANYSLSFCIYSFTQNTIANAMLERYRSQSDFTVRGVFDYGQMNAANGEYQIMAGKGSSGWSPAADVHLDAVSDLLHHKYLLVDANHADSDPVLVTGSHNWSYAANNTNDENTLIIHDRGVVNLYAQEFAARYHDAGGTGEITSQIDQALAIRQQPDGFSLRQNYPNPFNSRTVIPLFIPPGMHGRQDLLFYDRTGAEISRQAVNTGHPGWHEIVWEAKDRTGKPLPSGLYFCRVQNAPFRVIKLLLVR
jgi:phosphatidylserine/phosphatidylglycerophosphate/cardiolipin synthase-like enzyme